MHPGERIGLVGPNGAGKTTLLKIIAGKEDADAGTVELHPSLQLGYLEQHPEVAAGRTLWEEACSALDALIALEHEAIEVAHALSEAKDPDEHRRLASRFDHLQQELHRHDAYQLDHKIERVLAGLGFEEKHYQQPVESLSGGEQNRLMLSKLLLAQPDLLLLDEPSNHLDIEATEWLEEYLTSSRAAMILVSHDRYFLDKVTNRTFELFRGTVDAYVGNFSAYWQQKAERILVERRTYEKQQEEIAKTEDFIRRNHYGQKHAQAEDRRKKLERIERIDPPREIAVPAMGFPAVSRSGDIVVRAEGLAKGFDRPLFRNLSLDILRGQRWGILGPNGSGKTTLLRCLLGQIEPDAGRISLGQGVSVGYFDQHLASLDNTVEAVDAVRPEHKEFLIQKRRDLLGRFGLSGDTALQPIGKLSGGERCRVALARLAASDANFLVLDEPTNHLDLWARDALERSLREFDGTVLFVSHDRYFINQVADRLLVVESDRFRVIEGNYETYLGHDAASQAAQSSSGSKDAKTSKSRDGKGGASAGKSRDAKAAMVANAKKEGASTKKRRFPYRKVEEIEGEIFERESRIEELHTLLTQPETYRDGDQARELKSEIVQQQSAIEELYAHWEEASELNW